MFKMMSFSLNTGTQPGTPLINGFVNEMSTRHLRHFEILRGQVSSQEVQ